MELQDVLPGDFWEAIYLGHTVADWVLVAAIWALVASILVAVKRYSQWRLVRLAKRRGNNQLALVARAVKKTTVFFLLTFALYLATNVLNIGDPLSRWIGSVMVVVMVFQLIRWADALIGLSIEQYKSARLDTDAASVTTVQAMGFVGRLILYTVLVIIGLDNLGIQVTGLIAGLGIGGIAVALAVQNILGDLFASLSIVLDKPFVIGDFLIVDNYLGTVEYIGLKTTRLRSLSGEQIVFSNSDLLKSRVRNFKRMFERRVVFEVSVVYGTPAETLEKISTWLREIVQARDQVRFDRAHMARFGDSAIVYEVVYFVLAPEFNLYMDIQEQINLAIYRCFRENGIDFAFPTRTLYMKQENGTGNGAPWEGVSQITGGD
jgi:small-conductance mechanosensitive channel